MYQAMKMDVAHPNRHEGTHETLEAVEDIGVPFGAKPPDPARAGQAECLRLSNTGA